MLTPPSTTFVSPRHVTASGNSYIILFTYRFGRHADIHAVTVGKFMAEYTENILVNKYTPLRGFPSTFYQRTVRNSSYVLLKR